MVKANPKGKQTATTKSTKSAGVQTKVTAQRRRRSIINSLPIRLGLIFNGLSVGFGCSIFALSLAYIVGVIGTQETKFDEISCQNLTLNIAPNLKPDFVLSWQCNYFQIEFWTASMTAIAGLFQMLFCLVVLLTDQIGWNAWMYPHVAVATLLAVSIILLFVVFSTTADRSLYQGLRGTPNFWHETSPHMGITNAEPVLIQFLVLFYSAWMLFDFIFCFFAIFIANEKRQIALRALKPSAVIKEDVYSAPAKSASDKSITSYPESKPVSNVNEEMQTINPENMLSKERVIGPEEKAQIAVPVGVQGKLGKKMKGKITTKPKERSVSTASDVSQSSAGSMRKPPTKSKLKKQKPTKELSDF
ncbi:unnamed protein product [Allacma fusca]|uniref:Uncharacterized protein n=1 Tax=Allacma fusca TaxID=39272 RepID=A0A8J2K3E4_9HEXA|nr:unnamed protein product [Allacma fusca]